MEIKSNGEINYKKHYKKMDARLIDAHYIAYEFKLNPYDVEDNWGDKQIIDTVSFLKELYKRK